jgi:hypothetical protein
MNDILFISEKKNEVKKDIEVSNKKDKLLQEIINNNQISNQNKIRAIWITLENKNIKFNDYISNITISDSNLFNGGFHEFIKLYGFKNDSNKKNAFITSKNRSGRYSVNFTDVDNNRYINKMSLTKWCESSPYYPKSFIATKKEDFNKLPLNQDQKYFVKSIFGVGSKSIGISMGNKLIYRPDILEKVPVVVQEGVKNMRLNEGRKEDERVYVLWVKINGKIRVFLHTKTMVRMCKKKYSESIAKDTHFTIQVNNPHGIIKSCKNPCEVDRLIPVVSDISKRVMSHISKKMLNNHVVEFWLTGWDILFDTNNHPWLLEINSRPNQCESVKSRLMHYPIYQQIYEMINSHYNNREFELKDFIEIFY